jgi:hypothetical protein
VHFTWRFYLADRRTKSSIARPQAKRSLSLFPSVQNLIREIRRNQRFLHFNASTGQPVNNLTQPSQLPA